MEIAVQGTVPFTLGPDGRSRRHIMESAELAGTCREKIGRTIRLAENLLTRMPTAYVRTT